MKYKCAFCGKEHEGYGNSSWPTYNDESIRCCDNCNKYVVVPERIKRSKIKEEQLKNENKTRAN